jgi:hypothetical protein
MGLVGQEVLSGDVKGGIRIGDELQWIKNGPLSEAIKFVAAAAKLVVLAEGVVDAADGGVVVLDIWLEKGTVGFEPAGIEPAKLNFEN